MAPLHVAVAIADCCGISLLRGRQRCSWCRAELAALVGTSTAGVPPARERRAGRLALARAYRQHCLAQALHAPALRRGVFSADDVQRGNPTLSRVAISRQLQAWALSGERIAGATVHVAGEVGLGAGRRCQLWRLQVHC